MASWRSIVVGDRRYQWRVTGDDDGVRVLARSAELAHGRPMMTWFSHDNLVTPWLVRHAIEHALAGGWTPLERGTAQMFSIKGVLPDRPRNVPTPAPITVTEDELLARIAESADDDDQARLVYADWLLERSDERGELVMLSCYAATRALDAEEAARLAALEARRETSLGPVAHVTRLRAWSRGLLDYAQLGKRDQGVVDLAIGHPAWHSVRHLDSFGQFFAVDDIARLVGQPTLRSLRTLMIDSRIAHKLAAEPASDRFDQLTSLAISHHGAPITAEAVAALEAAMPRLQELVVGARSLPDLLAIFAITRVRTLVLQDPGFIQLAALRTQLDQVSSSVEEVRFATWWRGFDSTGAMLGLRRGLDHRWSALELGWSGADFPAARTAMISTVAALPPDALTRVTIRRSTMATPFDDVGFVRELRRALHAQRAFPTFEL